ncbi:hypothetical protein BLNAU_1896 [Blattamonas nauphoetae]|uniref:Uncharacterized protein n=1 Tax=Blattamonas nauphoetae TaxID=2049346 RepID=A0ABQ9YHY0_9EUKA|nr:hypothetical protein BLNAU_1896 [Blattamonas nauphoetae]
MSEFFLDFQSMDETNDLEQIRVETTQSAQDTIEALIVSMNKVPSQNTEPTVLSLESIISQFDDPIIYIYLLQFTDFAGWRDPFQHLKGR